MPEFENKKFPYTPAGKKAAAKAKKAKKSKKKQYVFIDLYREDCLSCHGDFLFIWMGFG